MKIEQIYTGCLAQGAYYITSNGEAAIIDPLRDISPYIDRLAKDDVSLKYIFETHFHADFVSGHLSLAKETNAPIVFGPTAEPNFKALIAKDCEEFKIGDVSIVAIHTPGHTMESTTYLLRDENGEDVAIFTGDTLFLGDVGRPDLATGGDITVEKLASILYDSLREKIMPLNDDITVYPGHGAGSACGKKMSNDTVDTLGNQKKTNYALRADMTRDEFIKEVTDGIPVPPAYFPMNAKMNKGGYTDFDDVLNKGLKALSVEDFEKKANEYEAVILDVRHQDDFSKGHIPGSIFIGLHGDFAPWVGTVIGDVKTPILLVTEKGQEEEAVTRLSRVGFDHILGYLQDGFASWVSAHKEADTVESIEAEAFAKIYNKNIPVFDVRKDGEYEAQHIENAQFAPLAVLNNYIQNIPKQQTFYVYCQGGYRSMIASSILKNRGYHHLINILGGFNALQETPIKTVGFCTLAK